MKIEADEQRLDLREVVSKRVSVQGQSTCVTLVEIKNQIEVASGISGRISNRNSRYAKTDG